MSFCGYYDLLDEVGGFTILKMDESGENGHDTRHCTSNQYIELTKIFGHLTCHVEKIELDARDAVDEVPLSSNFGRRFFDIESLP